MTIWISRDPEVPLAFPDEIYFWTHEPKLTKNEGWASHGGGPLGYLPVSSFTNPIAAGTCVPIGGLTVQLLKGET